jgi:hypothetical protein
LWAGNYLGAEGFEQGHNFTVWNNIAGFVFAGPSLDENALRLAAVGSSGQSSAIERLKAVSKLDGDWWVSAMPALKSRVGTPR